MDFSFQYNFKNPKLREIYTQIIALGESARGREGAEFGDVVRVGFGGDTAAWARACELARALKPWRKGPFELVADLGGGGFLGGDLRGSGAGDFLGAGGTSGVGDLRGGVAGFGADCGDFFTKNAPSGANQNAAPTQNHAAPNSNFHQNPAQTAPNSNFSPDHTPTAQNPQTPTQNPPQILAQNAHNFAQNAAPNSNLAQATPQNASLFIDSEWRSFVKYNALAAHFDLRGRVVADVGCNNGYYAMRFAADGAAAVVGFDPSELFLCQFLLLESFAKSGVKFAQQGVEDIGAFAREHGAFDVIFCLGVLYHRSDPIATLKALKSALARGGEVYLDTMCIDGDEPVALCPAASYSKIPNIAFVPSIPALQNWCERAKFSGFELLFTTTTTPHEQRKTEWIDGESLGDFLDPRDKTRTIEGYPAPKRAYVRLRG